jgi:hypothetical protein
LVLVVLKQLMAKTQSLEQLVLPVVVEAELVPFKVLRLVVLVEVATVNQETLVLLELLIKDTQVVHTTTSTLVLLPVVVVLLLSVQTQILLEATELGVMVELELLQQSQEAQ